MKLASFGTFWTSQLHLLNESANVNFMAKVLESLDFSTESGFLMQMVRIWSGSLKKMGLNFGNVGRNVCLYWYVKVNLIPTQCLQLRFQTNKIKIQTKFGPIFSKIRTICIKNPDTIEKSRLSRTFTVKLTLADSFKRCG